MVLQRKKFHIVVGCSVINKPQNINSNHSVLRIIAIFAFFSSLWVCFSETFVGWLIQDPTITSSRIDILHGLLFIIAASSILYLLFFRYIRHLEKSEQSLRESEQCFRSVFELAAVGVALVDPRTGKFVKINAKYCAITGYSADEMVGRRFQDITHIDDRQADLDNTARLLDGAIKTYSLEKRYMHRNGYIVWVSLTVSPLWLEGQEPNCQIVIINDITASKAEELALMQSEEQYRKVIEDQTEIICRIKEDGTFLYVNDVYCRVFGKTRDELQGAKWPSIVFLDDIPRVEERLRTLSLSNPVVAIESRVYFGSGEVHWMQFVNSGFFDKDGRLVEIQSVGRDITERKNVEIELLESNELLQAVINGSEGAIFVKDRYSRILLANPTFLRLMEKSFEEVVGKQHTEIHSDPEIAGTIYENDRRIMESRQAEMIEEVVQGHDGLHIFLSYKMPRFDTDGRVIGIICVSHDITKIRKAEEDRLVLERQFQQAQKMESLGVLAGGVAHDFNNILTIILGHCHILNKEINSGMTFKEHVQQIEAAGSRAVGLCRQMLTYAGQSAQVQVRVNLWPLVDGVVEMLKSAIKKNVTVKLDLRHDVPELTGDNVQIQQVVMNLILNAAEAIGDKSGTIKVALKNTHIQTGQSDTDFMGNTIPTKKYACLEVSDTGCGIDKENERRVFEPFYTTKSAGRGLGMSAVLGIVKSHDGALRLTSGPGIGTTIQVYFPLPDKDCSIETIQASGFVPSAKARGTVLLVDDEVTMRVIGSALLNAMGFSTITASNGREALDIYNQRKNEVDLILMGLIMPEMAGIDSYRLLREISRSIPIVICSGFGDDRIWGGIANDEHAAVVQKPYKSNQLQDTLITLLDKKGSKFQ
ncbi:MAG: PAS domain S-box protein [Desulfuromonadaceae bacterium]|nr:PAS domain S-box protein [Desulfuromonadaceae bacterium]